MIALSPPVPSGTETLEVKKRGIEPIWTLQVLDEAAERGLVSDLSGTLERLERETTFYVGEKARAVIEDMKQRDRQRKQAREQPAAPPEPSPD